LLVVLSLALAGLDSGLRTEAAPYGIVSFELARTADASAAILASWGPSAREAAHLIQGLDYLYLMVYAALLATVSSTVAGRWRHRSTLVAGLGSLVTGLALVAGLLDAIENYALLRQLADGASAGWAALAWWCAVPKFVIVGLAATYTVVGYLGAVVFIGRDR
jgi:hypothetical protein